MPWYSFINEDVEEKSKQYSGYIMNKDLKVARVDNNSVTEIIDNKMCPIFVLRTKDFESWVMSRTIDSHRTNSRVLRKMLRLKDPDSLDIAMKAKCRTITDSFWFKEDNLDITFKDLKFKEDLLKDVALHGKSTSLELKKNTLTPELTNIGSYEKAWVLKSNDCWYLRKKATDLELLSEIFVYRLCKFLKYPCVAYKRVDKLSVIECKNFVRDEEWFEPAHSYIGMDEDYFKNYDILQKFEIMFKRRTLCRDYLRMLFIDALVQNPDRHTFNYGVLIKDGEIVRFAPNFDNNLALVARGLDSINTFPSRRNPLIRDFIDLIRGKSVQKFYIPDLKYKDILLILEDICLKNNIDFIEHKTLERISEYVMNNYNIIKEEIRH